MCCQIWQFQLRNTLKLSGKKKKYVEESTTLFFKTMFFFYRVLMSFFTCLSAQIRPSTKTKKCSWDKTREGHVVLDYAISAQKYP